MSKVNFNPQGTLIQNESLFVPPQSHTVGTKFKLAHDIFSSIDFSITYNGETLVPQVDYILTDVYERARQNLGLTVYQRIQFLPNAPLGFASTVYVTYRAVGDFVNADELFTQEENDDRYLQKNKLLQDLPHKPSARAALEVYGKEEVDDMLDTTMKEANNLSDVADKTEAVFNLLEADVVGDESVRDSGVLPYRCDEAYQYEDNHGKISLGQIWSWLKNKIADILGLSENNGTKTFAGNVTGNASTATAADHLQTARKTYVTLGTASNTTTRDWSGDTTIPVNGTLGVGNGGTGQTTAKAAGSALLKSLDADTTACADTDYFAIAASANTTWVRRTLATLWTWIAGKISSVLKLTATSYDGNAKTATTATKLGTANVGAAATPIYLAAGVPTACTGITANTTAEALTFNNGGSGAASGTTFNGSAAKTISYNTVGAAAASHTHDTISGLRVLTAETTFLHSSMTYTNQKVTLTLNQGKRYGILGYEVYVSQDIGQGTVTVTDFSCKLTNYYRYDITWTFTSTYAGVTGYTIIFKLVYFS